MCANEQTHIEYLRRRVWPESHKPHRGPLRLVSLSGCGDANDMCDVARSSLLQLRRTGYGSWVSLADDDGAMELPVARCRHCRQFAIVSTHGMTFPRASAG